jgi:hypothetical protein
VAAQFEEADFAPAGDWSVSLPAAGGILELTCDPLFHGRPGRGRTADLEPLAARQPFTVHALLHEPISDRFLDPLGVRADIQRGVLRRIPRTPWMARARAGLLFEAVWLECHEGLEPDPALLGWPACPCRGSGRDTASPARAGKVLASATFNGLVGWTAGSAGTAAARMEMLRAAQDGSITLKRRLHPHPGCFGAAVPLAAPWACCCDMAPST